MRSVLKSSISSDFTFTFHLLVPTHIILKSCYCAYFLWCGTLSNICWSFRLWCWFTSSSSRFLTSCSLCLDDLLESLGDFGLALCLALCPALSFLFHVSLLLSKAWVILSSINLQAFWGVFFLQNVFEQEHRSLFGAFDLHRNNAILHNPASLGTQLKSWQISSVSYDSCFFQSSMNQSGNE